VRQANGKQIKKIKYDAPNQINDTHQSQNAALKNKGMIHIILSAGRNIKMNATIPLSQVRSSQANLNLPTLSTDHAFRLSIERFSAGGQRQTIKITSIIKKTGSASGSFYGARYFGLFVFQFLGF